MQNIVSDETPQVQKLNPNHVLYELVDMENELAIPAVRQLAQDPTCTADMLAKFLKTEVVDWNPRDQVSMVMLEVMWEKSHDFAQLLDVVFSEGGLDMLEVDTTDFFDDRRSSERSEHVFAKAFKQATMEQQLDAVVFVLKRGQWKSPLHLDYFSLAGEMLSHSKVPQEGEVYHLKQLVFRVIDEWRRVDVEMEDAVGCINLLKRLCLSPL